MSISWGKQERFKFNGSGALVSWDPPAVPAVFAITYKNDPQSKSHTILYMGQADDLSREAPEFNRHVMGLWTSSGHDANELYVFVRPMPSSTSQERFKIQEQLIAEYHPQANRY